MGFLIRCTKCGSEVLLSPSGDLRTEGLANREKHLQSNIQIDIAYEFVDISCKQCGNEISVEENGLA